MSAVVPVHGKPDTRYFKTLRIAPTGDVDLTRLEVAIIDSVPFQRLRRIKQLGPAAWVYPTALHTRFDHSIGALQTVEEMVSLIRKGTDQTEYGPQWSARPCVITESQRLLARLYALLHDITHVPFGHTLEDELNIFPSHDAAQGTGSEAEEGKPRFEAFLGRDSEIGRLIVSYLGQGMYDRFRNIYLKGSKQRLEIVEEGGHATADEFVYYLVSDTVCADLIDYLKRDSFFCDLGLRTPDRILKYLYVADIPVGGEVRRRVIIRLWKLGKGTPRHDVMTDLAALLEARYMLAERVYFHPAKIIVGTMIGRAALEAELAGAIEGRDLWKIGDDTFLDGLTRLSGEQDPPNAESLELSSRLAQAVVERRLFICQKHYRKENFDNGAVNESPRRTLIETCKVATRRRSIENEIAEIAGAEPGQILLYVGPEKMNLKVAEAVVDWCGEFTTLSEMREAPTLVTKLNAIQDSHRRLWTVDLLVDPALSAEQRRLAQLAFEYKFFAAGEAVDKLDLLMKETVARHPRLGNRSRHEIDQACRKAAEDLVLCRREFHGRRGKVLSAFLEAVQSHLHDQVK